MVCRGKNSYVDELHLNDPDHNPASSVLLLERSVATESEPCSTEMEQSSIEETHTKQFEIHTNPVYNNSQEVVRIEENGAVHWNSMVPKLRKAFQKAGGQQFSDSDWLQCIYEGCNKTRFKYCKNSKHVLLYIRAIRGHTGGDLIAPELMVHSPVSADCIYKVIFQKGDSSRVPGSRSSSSKTHRRVLHLAQEAGAKRGSRLRRPTTLGGGGPTVSVHSVLWVSTPFSDNLTVAAFRGCSSFFKISGASRVASKQESKKAKKKKKKKKKKKRRRRKEEKKKKKETIDVVLKNTGNSKTKDAPRTPRVHPASLVWKLVFSFACRK